MFLKIKFFNVKKMPMIQIYSNNRKRYCNAYFKIITNPNDDTFYNPEVICNTDIETRCLESENLHKMVNEIRDHMGFCRAFSKNKKMIERFEKSIETISCALECSGLAPSMSADEYIFTIPDDQFVLLPVIDL
jgi:hypothetical protein